MGAQNTQFPQRDRDTVTFAVFDGLRNDVAPERFELGDLAVADNIDIDKSGRIARRDGFTSRLALAAHSLWADEMGDMCAFVAGGYLNRLAPDMTSSQLTLLADGASPMSYARVSDRVYFSNGLDKGIVEGGRVRSWGLPVAPLPGASAAVGQMPAGTFKFAMTWLRADGQESGCGLSGQITLPAGGAIAFTTPVAPQADIVAAELYLSAANSDVMRYAAQVAPGQSLTWTADPMGLSMELQTQFLGPAPAGQLVAFYRGRMFIAQGDTIYYSEPFAYELFNLRNYLQLDGRITMLAPFMEKDRSLDTGSGSGFFVGTDRSTGVLSGTDPDTFQYVPKVDYGAIPGTLVYADGTVIRDGASGARKLPMWLSTNGICVGLPDLLINNLTRSKYGFAAGGRGAAVMFPDRNRYVATANL